jgi:hypothetical protein
MIPPFAGRNREKMGRHSMITAADILSAVKMLRRVTRAVLVLFFGGDVRRIKALEKLLPALEREGRLFSERVEREKVYSIPGKANERPVSLAHEIACALILVLLWRCRLMEDREIVPERAFRGFGIVPEGGIRYSAERKTMLILEYSTRSNFAHGGVMKSKITRYKKYLPDLEAKFKRYVTVLFVIDTERHKVKEFIRRMQKILDEPVMSGLDGSPEYPFFFTDYQTFKTVSVGQALTAKIYFWNDGNEWRLTEND